MVGAGGGGGRGPRGPGPRPFRGHESHRRFAGGGARAPGGGPSPRCGERGEAASSRIAAHRRPREPAPSGHRRAVRRAAGTASRAPARGEVGRPRAARGPSAASGASRGLGGHGAVVDSRIGRGGLCPTAGEAVLPASPGRPRSVQDGPRSRIRWTGGGAAAHGGSGRAGVAYGRTVARPLSGAPRGVRIRGGG